MALFDSKEEKAEKRLLKEEEQFQKFIKKYNLQELELEDMEALKKLLGTAELKALTSPANLPVNSSNYERQTTALLTALTAQNWLIISQLSRISKSLSEK